MYSEFVRHEGADGLPEGVDGFAFLAPWTKMKVIALRSESAHLSGMESDPFQNKRHALRHVLEQHVLPEAAFSMHPRLLECVRKGDGRGLLHFCSIALVRCLRLQLIQGDAESDENMQMLVDLSSKMRLRSESEGGVFIQVLTMPDPEVEMQAYRIAFAQCGLTKEAPVRYFLLEKAAGVKPMLCERTRDGSHLNYGELEPDTLSLFSLEVEFIVSRSLPPKSSLGKLLG